MQLSTDSYWGRLVAYARHATPLTTHASSTDVLSHRFTLKKEPHRLRLAADLGEGCWKSG